jgi:hypothetical protein
MATHVTAKQSHVPVDALGRKSVISVNTNCNRTWKPENPPESMDNIGINKQQISGFRSEDLK